MGSIVEIEEDKCIGCEACVSICPQKILEINSETGKVSCIDESKCDKLGGCEHVCPVEAIHIH